MSEPSSSLRARVLAAARSPSPTRAQGRRVAALIAALSVAVDVAVFESMGGFHHGAGRPAGFTIGLTTGWALACAVLTWIVVGRGQSTLGRRPAWVAGCILAAPVVLFLWMQLFYGTYPEPYQAVGLRCLRAALVEAALPLAGFLALRRAVEPRRPHVLGAGVGTVSAAWAGVFVDVWCPLTNPAHVVVGHVAPLLAGAVIGAVAGHFTLGVRGQERRGTTPAL